MKTVLIALACSAALAPAAQAKSSPKLTDAQINAAANAVARSLDEPVDGENSSCIRTSRTSAECNLYVRRDGEPGNNLVPAGECVVPVTILLRKRKVRVFGGYATGPHMQGYCAVRS